MARSRNLRLVMLALALLGVATALAVGWREGRRHERADGERTVVFASTRAHDAHLAAEEAVRLYAAGQFARACERFSHAAADEPTSEPRRQDVVRCFEGWGWHVLREGRPDEAALLFSRGLAETPDDPALLKGLGLAAVHSGRPHEALGPLERAVRAEPDPDVRLLLAHLHDHRDDPAKAITHLRAVLEREPSHEAARKLLAKVERERRAEAGFQRDVTPRFVVKYAAAGDREARRAIIAHLETAAERVGRLLGYTPQQRTTVVLYEHDEFRDVTRAHSWAKRLVVHEYAHAAIHDLSRGRAPRWLHEGLAQVLEGTASDPMLQVPGGLTLAGVEALAGESDPLRARAGYDIALWVVRDLLDRGGIEALRELLSRLGAGESVAEAMPRVYGLRLTELESQWRRVLGG